MKNDFTLDINSSLEKLETVQQFAEKIIQDCQLDNELGGNFALVLSEACTNAIIHGNKQDENKKVSVHVQNLADKLMIKVKDQGDGFNPSDVPNPLAEENLLKPGGRGVYLIKEYADDVQYNNKGNQVTITFQKTS